MEINVCFATNDRYAPHAAALVTSIIKNKSPEDELSFHFLADKITPFVQNAFLQMSLEMGFNLTIYEMSDKQFGDFPVFAGSRTCYFFLAMSDVLPDSITKILCLDCDMIVTTSLKELYLTNISEYYAAVVAEASKTSLVPIEHAYFNSGMVLLNLEKYRGENLKDQAIKIAYEHPGWMRLPDQNILNYMFEGNVVYLPPKWNRMFNERYEEMNSFGHQKMYPYTVEEIHEAEISPSIIHYATSKKKPWKAFCEHPFRNLYWKYIHITPFCREAVKQYRLSWISSLYRRYFRINLSRTKVHVMLFGVNVVLWKRVKTEPQ